MNCLVVHKAIFENIPNKKEELAIWMENDYLGILNGSHGISSMSEEFL